MMLKSKDMRRYLVIVLFVLASIGLANAQEFKEGLLYDLTGNVKEMKLSTKSSFLKKHVKFRDNGKCKKSITFFDDENYPLGYDMSMNTMKFAMSQKVKYDDRKRIASVTQFTSYDGGITQTTTNYYSNEAAPLQIGRSVYTYANKDSEWSADCEYTDYIYDDNGNWISRQVKQTTTQTNKKGEKGEEVSEYTETRTIKYF